jgi:exosortase A-associated hydrolase 1
VSGPYHGIGKRGGKLARVNFVERALTFECSGEMLVGILAEPASPAVVGVLIIVGGPQYRAGSHRQFVLLSRQLAAGGVAAMRFDYRGMGDATGSPSSFADVAEDIAAAIDAMRISHPSLEQIVLCGLCDAASASLIYWQATRDPRVAGMVLLNPWVRSEAGIGRARIKHYYARRLLEKEFWAKLARGRVAAGRGIREVIADFLAARQTHTTSLADGSTFQDRMATGLRTFGGPVLMILSGRDLTAKEFLDYGASNPQWRGLLDRANVSRHDMNDADHTFSSNRWRREVEAVALSWLRRSFVFGPE